MCFPRPTVTTSHAFARLAAALLVVGLAAAARADTLDRVRSEGKLRIGYAVYARPFAYRNEQGHPTGFTIALCERVGQAVKTELGNEELAIEFIPITSDYRFDSADPNRVDLFCGAVATLDRRQRFAFSIPIFPGGIGALLRADAPDRLVAVLEGREPPIRPNWRASLGQVLEQRVLSAQAGTAAETWLINRRDELKVNPRVEVVPSYPEGVRRVVSGRSDVFFGDRAILLDTAARSPDAGELIVLARIFSYQPFALGMPLGDETFRLLVDQTLSRIYRSGEIDDLYSEFFGKPDANAQAFYKFMALPE